jgi:hypothetical protein
VRARSRIVALRFVNPPFAEFRSAHEAAIRQAYARAKAARWNLDETVFAAALEAAVADALANDSRADAQRLIESLNVEDLALAAACGEGIAAAWDFFVSQYRPILYAAARAIAGDESRARELADSIYADL